MQDSEFEELKHQLRNMMVLFYTWRKLFVKLKALKMRGETLSTEEWQTYITSWEKFNKWADYFMEMLKQDKEQRLTNNQNNQK